MFRVSSCLKFLSRKKIWVAIELDNSFDPKVIFWASTTCKVPKMGKNQSCPHRIYKLGSSARYANHQNRTQPWQMIQGRGNGKEWWKLAIGLGTTEGFTQAWGVWTGLCNKLVSTGGHCEEFSHKGCKAARWESTEPEKSHQILQGDGSNTRWCMGGVIFDGHNENSVLDPGLWESQRCALRGRG